MPSESPESRQCSFEDMEKRSKKQIIYERIREIPGIHLSALMKDLDIKPGVASYHINKLEKARLIKSVQNGMYRRFYPFEQDVHVRVLLSDLQNLIMIKVEEQPGISQANVSRSLGRNKVVVHHNIRFLRNMGLLSLVKDGRETHCFSVLQEHNVQ